MMTTFPTQLDIQRASKGGATPDWETLRCTLQRFTTPSLIPDLLRSCVPELSSHSSHITECEILDAKLKKYLKPASLINTTLSVCYQVALREPLTDTISQHIFYLKAFVGGRSAEAARLLTHDECTATGSPPPVRYVPEQDMIVWRFPYDPTLPHLHQVVDLQTVTQYLPLESLSQSGLSEPPQVMAGQVVNYRPEIRCTNRYDLYDVKHDRSYQLFGKTFRSTEGASLYERLQHFWNQSLIDRSAMAVAQPLGYAASVHTVWQRGIPGTPLRQVLNTSNSEHYIKDVAKGLASLHRTIMAELPLHTPADHISETRKKLVKLADAVPHLAPRCAALADEVERTAPRPATIPSRPIHWDFHIDQLLAYQGKLVFCDLDELINGDPLQDLANFIVDLQFRNLDARLIQRVATDLYDTYRQQVDWGVPIERLAWHARIQFINKAYRHYLRFAPGFEQTVEQIIRMAEKELCI